jgi:Fe-S-cluster containining protein
MKCRENCGACCIAISISSPIPGMPAGKPAGVRCIHLTHDNRCAIYDTPLKPKVCSDFKAEPEFCGNSREEALRILGSIT